MIIEHVAVKKIVEQLLLTQNLNKRRTIILVGVSGGPDSVCLLHSLVNLRKNLGFKLHAAHLNHKLRGEESDDDAYYVISLCQRLDVDATIDTFDVATYSKEKHLSLEEGGRELRYNYFSRLSGIINASCLALGHTRDDHVETILMHILRGTGIDGLQGLQNKSTFRDSNNKSALLVIRPLLEVSRQETNKYCRFYKLNPRIDSSNNSTLFFRNRIRLKLLPDLRKYNPEIDAALLRLSSVAIDQASYIAKQADKIWDTTTKIHDNLVYIDKQKMVNLAPAMQRQIYRMAVQTLRGSTKDFESVHIEEMMAFLTKKPGKSLCLPHGLKLSVEYDNVVLALKGTSSCDLPLIASAVELKVPGKTIFPGWKVVTKVSTCIKEDTLKQKNVFTSNFDLDKTGKLLFVRGRAIGDRFRPLGMSRLKKIQDFMVDAHIPRSYRDHIPLVCSLEQILWVVGYRIDDRAKVRSSTTRIITISFERMTT